jgi:molecular chaperone GrpE
VTKSGKHRPANAGAGEAGSGPAEAAPAEGMVPVPAAGDAPEAPVPEAAPAPSEADQLKDRLLRLAADFDNFRKRTQRERSEITRRACQDVLSDVLPVIDHLELAVRHAQDTAGGAGIADGVALVLAQLQGVLRKYGAEPIAAEGTAFDPQCHEAVMYQPSEELPEGIVLAQTRAGYRLGEVVLRPAQVIVSSGPAAGPDGED